MERHGNLTKRLLATPVFLAVALLLAPGVVRAHEGEFDGEVYPENESVLTGTPRELVILDENPSEVRIELKKAGGAAISFTGTPVLDADSVSVTPPVLEPGTYILTWKGSGGEKVSVFSIGSPDAEVSANGGGFGGAPGRLLAWLILVGTWAGGSVLGRRRLSVERGSILLAATIPGAAAGVLLYGFSSIGAITAVALSSIGAIGLAGAAAGNGLREFERPLRLLGTVVGWSLTLCLVAGALLTGDGMLAGLLLGAALLVNLLAGAAAGARIAAGNPAGRIGAAGLLVLTLAVGGVAVSDGVDVAFIEKETAALASCFEAGNRLEIQRCMEGSLVAVAETENVNAALKSLEGLMKSEGRARYFCHEASHAVGRASLRINNGIAEAFRDGYDVCDFGYYHGIVEGASAGMNDQDFERAVSTLCAEFASAEELFFMQCNHGLGHAAARRTNNDMLRALDFCGAIENTDGLEGDRLEVARNGCGTGVTMEWFATATLSENPTVTPKVDKPRDVCHQVPTEWAAECYEYVGNTLDASDPVSSLLELGAWCSTSPQVGPCYKGLARAAAGVGISDRDAIGVCDTAKNSDDRDGCVTYYIATVATTLEFSEKPVERICALLPERDRIGTNSLCEQVLQAVRQVLAGGDGKATP
jgi:hypothetical protein